MHGHDACGRVAQAVLGFALLDPATAKLGVALLSVYALNVFGRNEPEHGT
jgi:hypothetical protein